MVNGKAITIWPLLSNNVSVPVTGISDLDEELSLASIADAVVVVLEADRRIMQDGGMQSVHVVGHSVPINPTPSFQVYSARSNVGLMTPTAVPSIRISIELSPRGGNAYPAT